MRLFHCAALVAAIVPLAAFANPLERVAEVEKKIEALEIELAKLKQETREIRHSFLSIDAADVAAPKTQTLAMNDSTDVPVMQAKMTPATKAKTSQTGFKQVVRMKTTCSGGRCYEVPVVEYQIDPVPSDEYADPGDCEPGDCASGGCLMGNCDPGCDMATCSGGCAPMSGGTAVMLYSETAHYTGPIQAAGRGAGRFVKGAGRGIGKALSGVGRAIFHRRGRGGGCCN